MSEFNPQVGDIGFELIAHFKTKDCSGAIIDFDISAKTTLELCLRKPDSTVVTKTAIFTPVPCGIGDGTDGKASYITILGDLDQAGVWHFSGHIVLSDGKEFRSSQVSFKVETPICP